MNPAAVERWPETVKTVRGDDGVNMPGVPAGWRAVRWGAAAAGEHYLNAAGNVRMAVDAMTSYWLIVEPAVSSMEWPNGQMLFSGGFITQDLHGRIYWHQKRPQPVMSAGMWTSHGATMMLNSPEDGRSFIRSLPVFDERLFWSSRVAMAPVYRDDP